MKITMNKPFVRSHPIAIVGYLSRALYLLVIPVARGLFLALRAGTLLAWAYGAWFDILVLLLIVGIAAIRWRLVLYRFDQTGLQLKKGLFYRREIFIPMCNIATMSVEYRMLLRPLRAVVLRADTAGGSTRQYDFELTVRRAEAEAALGARAQQAARSRGTKKVFFPHSLHIAALAAFLSNSFAGVLFAVTFVSRAGDVLGEKLQGRALSLLAEFSAAVSLGMPPLAAMLALVVLVGWFIGFVRNLLRLIRFRISRTGGLLVIDVGLLTRRRYSVAADKVFYLDIRQSLMTRLLRIYLVFIRCTGYGKGKNEAAVLIPSAT
ncbi:MAG: PH domain-containing protein, partial [Acetanaerobacterium sp.]